MAFTEQITQKVWNKAKTISDTNEEKGFRKDQCGAWVNRKEYGNRDSDWGWEIDHITPESQGGSDELNNLRPLHWRNNVSKSDGRLSCAVTSDGAKNINT